MRVSELIAAFQRGGEALLVANFKSKADSPDVPMEWEFPFDRRLDTVAYEVALRYGRADIVVFHADGGATVIEAKDGTKGYHHVVSGIGQVGLYAVQLHRRSLRYVRKALLWSSTGDLALDVLIEETCKAAGIVPMSWGRLADHKAATGAVLERFGLIQGVAC